MPVYAILNRKREITGWMSDFREGGERIRDPFKTKKEADEHYEGLEAKYWASASTAVPPGGLGDEPLERTLEIFEKGPRYIKRHKGMLPSIKRLVGDVKFSDLDDAWLENFIKETRGKLSYRDTPYSYATIVAYIHLISKATTWRARMTKSAPPTFKLDVHTMLPEDWDEPRSRRFEPGEEEAIRAQLATVQDPVKRWHWLALFDLALETGGRLQELVYIGANELSSNGAVWNIPKKRTKVKKERKVPLSPKAFEIVARLLAELPSGENRLLHALSEKASVSAVFHRHVKAVGIKDFRFHDLRHEAVSRAYCADIDTVPKLMLMFGHRDMATAQIYINMRDDDVLTADWSRHNQTGAANGSRRERAPQRHAARQPRTEARPDATSTPRFRPIAGARPASPQPGGAADLGRSGARARDEPISVRQIHPDPDLPRTILEGSAASGGAPPGGSRRLGGGGRRVFWRHPAERRR